MHTTAVSDETFAAEVLNSDIPVVVDFWAEWCGPCRQVAPILEEIAQEYSGRLKIMKLDTEANPEVTSAYGIISIPTLNIYVDGSLARSIIGARPKKALVTQIEEVLAGVHAGGLAQSPTEN